MTDWIERFRYWGEYDTTLQRGRIVPTYDPRRHCYRLRYAQPLGLLPPQAADPDDAMQEEPELNETIPPHAAGLQAAWAANEAKRKVREQAVLDLLRESEYALNIDEIREATGYSKTWLRNYPLRHPDVEVVNQRKLRGGQKYYGVRNTVYKRRPNKWDK